MLDQPAGLVGAFLRVFQKNFDRLDRHRAVAVHRNAGNLPGFHQLFDDEQKFLGTLDGKRGHNHAAPTLRRLADDLRQFRSGIVRRVLPVAVSRFHHQNVGRLAFGGSHAYNFSGRAVLITNAANVSTEQQSLDLAIQIEREFYHRRAQDVGRRDKAK